MAKPTAELLPWGAEGIPFLLGKKNAFLFVAVEHVVELLGGWAVYDYGILFIVEAHATCVKICGPHGTEPPVDHHNFGMVEPWLVEPYTGTTLHELMYIVEHTVGRKWHVALGRHHDVDLDPPVDGLLDGLVDRRYQREIGVDDAYGIVGCVDGRYI